MNSLLKKHIFWLALGSFQASYIQLWVYTFEHDCRGLLFSYIRFDPSWHFKTSPAKDGCWMWASRNGKTVTLCLFSTPGQTTGLHAGKKMQQSCCRKIINGMLKCSDVARHVQELQLPTWNLIIFSVTAHLLLLLIEQHGPLHCCTIRYIFARLYLHIYITKHIHLYRCYTDCPIIIHLLNIDYCMVTVDITNSTYL